MKETKGMTWSFAFFSMVMASLGVVFFGWLTLWLTPKLIDAFFLIWGAR